MNTDYLEQANQQFHNKNYQAALKNYDLAIQHSPSIPEAYYHRGLVKRILGIHHEAIQDLSIATILNPKMVLAYYYRGISYYEIGDFAYAIANYNHAIFLDSKLANAYYHRAIIYGELGRISSAIKDFKQAECLAKEQNNYYLQKKAKQAQVLAKRLKGNNRILLIIFKVGLLVSFLGVAIGSWTYFQDKVNNQVNPKLELLEYIKKINH
jgi:tetratricopeptide (TPR) repeat protein